MGRAYGCFLALLLGGILTSQLVLPFVFQFPLFDADSQVGYWPRKNQSGTFLFTNDWAFNDLGMGVAEEFEPSDKFDALLVGDSIVYGGNSLAQADKLGPLLEAKTGWQVWPVSAGSWSLQNELAYLRRIPVSQADAIVFVFNSEDFGEPSSWQSEFTHPRQYPMLFGPYLVGKFWLGEPGETPPELKVERSRDLAGDWRTFVQGKRVIVIGVPKKTERDCSWMPEWIGSFTCAKLNPDDYKDDIHPSASGRAKLVSLIAQ